jgi:hypothetical protein
MDDVQRALEKRARQLIEIDAAMERWHRRLSRAVGALDKLRAARKRLLKPRKLAPHERAEASDEFGDSAAL